MNGEELKKFIIEEVKKQEIKLLSEEEVTLPGRKPRKVVDPAEAPTKIQKDLPAPPVASDGDSLPGPPIAVDDEEETIDFIPLPPQKLQLVDNAINSLMKVYLDPETEVDEEVKSVLNDVVKKLNSISKGRPEDKLPKSIPSSLKGTRKSREASSSDNWVQDLRGGTAKLPNLNTLSKE